SGPRDSAPGVDQLARRAYMIEHVEEGLSLLHLEERANAALVDKDASPKIGVHLRGEDVAVPQKPHHAWERGGLRPCLGKEDLARAPPKGVIEIPHCLAI